jgi:putative membrane protein
MLSGKRYSFRRTLNFTKNQIVFFIIIGVLPVLLYQTFGLEWLLIPWQPISLIGIAVAFYLGFKNNSSYERMWEARKIWGGIVNASRSFTVMVRDYVNNDEAESKLPQDELKTIKREVVRRHIAWLHCLTLELRKLKDWEHLGDREQEFRKVLGVDFHPDKYDRLKKYLSDEDFHYVMSKDNRSSQLLSLQSKKLMDLRKAGILEHFRHLQIQNQITEFFTLQGKSERIKNFPFPRQYASVNYFFVILFVLLLPFGMLDIFTKLGPSYWIWLSVPFSVTGSWVFWMMEMVGDYSENPFEGLFNDVPITTIANGIEIDILQMLDETDVPEPQKSIQVGVLNILP